jgi:hypothetical protein
MAILFMTMVFSVLGGFGTPLRGYSTTEYAQAIIAFGF